MIHATSLLVDSGVNGQNQPPALQPVRGVAQW